MGIPNAMMTNGMDTMTAASSSKSRRRTFQVWQHFAKYKSGPWQIPQSNAL